MLYRTFSRQLVFSFVCCCAGFGLLPTATPAQTKAPRKVPNKVPAQVQPNDEAPAVNPMAPIYVTTRIFQLSAPRGQYPEVTDQLFRVTTASHNDETKWLASLKKLYPGFTPALLQTITRNVFRTSKPATLRLGQMDFSSIEVLLNGAQSPGDGGKPGTSLIAEVVLNQGNVQAVTPLTQSLHPIESESGKTYFFAARALKLSGENYVGFLRKGAPAARYANEDVILLCAFSVDLEKPAPSARYFGERDSIALQNEAAKKVQPVMPTELKQAGLSGKVQVRVEIAPDGKVAKAITFVSSFPEMNEAVIAAARQWEFAPALFANNQQPINGLLTFEFPATPAAEKQQSAK